MLSIRIFYSQGAAHNPPQQGWVKSRPLHDGLSCGCATVDAEIEPGDPGSFSLMCFWRVRISAFESLLFWFSFKKRGIVRRVDCQGGADPELFGNGWKEPDWAAIIRNAYFHSRPHSHLVRARFSFRWVADFSGIGGRFALEIRNHLDILTIFQIIYMQYWSRIREIENLTGY